MAEVTPCERPECDQPGKLRTITVPASEKEIEVHLCDEDYSEARAQKPPPRWFSELLNHIGLVG
jgi:hypothetical protein